MIRDKIKPQRNDKPSNIHLTSELTNVQIMLLFKAGGVNQKVRQVNSQKDVKNKCFLDLFFPVKVCTNDRYIIERTIYYCINTKIIFNAVWVCRD